MENTYHCYANRELSRLRFNERVLEKAEDSRVYIFGRGERARYYIGSADWMTRSTLRRVEIATPVFFLNRLLGTNFFFLNHPQGNAITVFFAHCLGEHFYVFGFLPVFAAVWVLLYLPWYRADKVIRRLHGGCL